jgi:hypothetical protein
MSAGATAVPSLKKPSKSAGLLLDPRIYCWLALLIALACLYRRLASAGDISDWISSDSLWPVNLVTDVFVDHYPLSGWAFSIAPCWFPDVFLVGIMYALARNVVVATILGGFAQFVLLIMAICSCWRALSLPKALAAEVATIIAGVTVTLYVALHLPSPYGGYHQFFLPQTHVGNLVNFVLALLFFLRLLGRQTRNAHHVTGAAFLLVCFLGTMSNVLFATHFLVPATFAVALLLARRDLGLRDASYLLAAWPAAGLGMEANRLLFTVTDVSVQSSVGWKPFRAARDTFLHGATQALVAGDFQHILALAWLLGCGAALFWLLMRQNDRSKQPGDALKISFFAVAAGASIMSAATIILGGSATLTAPGMYGWSQHYMHPMFLLPLFTWPVFIGCLPATSRRAGSLRSVLLVPALASAAVAVISFIETPRPVVPLDRYAPLLVRELDAYARLHGLRYGLGGYWQARLITMLSRTGLRVYQVDTNLEPYHWVSNIKWYTESFENRSIEPLFNFVLLNDRQFQISKGDVTAVMGKPDGEAAIAAVPVLLYARNTQAARDARCQPNVPISAAAFSGALDLPGSCLDGSIGRADHGAWKTEPEDAAGSARLPSLPLPRGLYSLQIDYDASPAGDAGFAAVQVSSGEKSLLSSNLGAVSSPFKTQFTVPGHPASDRVQVLVFFEGFGSMEVRRFIVRRLD